MNVLGFGDKIPSGDPEDVFISYCVEGYPGGMLNGPYKSRCDAVVEFNDIKTYEGVTNVKIVMRKDL